MIRNDSFLVCLSIICLCPYFMFGQYPNHELPQYPAQWNAEWITHPDIDKAAYGLIHFRNTFSLDSKPEQFIVHVSGDNRYRLYVNGQEVCYGPQLGDKRHWRYETLDLAPFLQAGSNTLAAEVINWGIERSYGIISFKTGFLLQGHGEAEQVAGTLRNCNWKVLKNEGMYEKTVFWRGGGDIVGGFYAANPTDSIVSAQFPWGWQEPGYDDASWLCPEVIFAGAKVIPEAGHGWILQARTTAIQENEVESIGKVIRSDLIGISSGFEFDHKSLEIPANSSHKILIDRGYVTLGYPKLELSGGNGARVKVRYSEALYDKDNHKGNRNEFDGKEIHGMSDVYVMDGSYNRVFQPLWFRAFRFIQLEITTADEPLTIEDYFNVYSAASFPVEASFETDDPLYDQVWDLCWHTMKICAQDNLLSDAYYEQMQYVGDLRPHLMGWTALTGDLTYFRSAMQQFNNSRMTDGNITSCYPLKGTFVHPTYSLIWIDMLHDLMMLEGDKDLLESYTGEIQEVFDFYESIIDEDGLVGKSNYHMFVDWYEDGSGGSPITAAGNSALLTLNYAYSLQKAADILDWLGYRDKGETYHDQSIKYASLARNLCYDEAKGVYADDPGKTFYDQRTSILAILTGAHSVEEHKKLMQKVLDDNVHYDSYANLFYMFYLFEAMQKTGVGDFTAALQPWQDILDLGMSGTPEKRVQEHPRSEIHPWTAHPVHFYFSVVAGINPTKPGFKKVRIAPIPGSLKHLHASYPTQNGTIVLAMVFGPEGEVTGEIILPEQVSGMFAWRGKEMHLVPGKNTIDLED